MSTRKRHELQTQNTALTLAQGLRGLYDARPELERGIVGRTAEIAEMFRGHDCIHIVFGCSTDISGEFRVDCWTLLALEPLSRASRSAAWRAS